MLLRLLIFALFLTAMNVFSQTPVIETGVSQTLAKWRAANYSDVRYKLNITLEKNAPLMKGDIEIRVNLTDAGAKNDLILDWRATQFQNDKDKPYASVSAVNGATGARASRLQTSPTGSVIEFDFARVNFQPDFRARALNESEPLALQWNEHLLIARQFLKTGENIIKINFASPIKTSGAAITRYVDKEDGAEYVYSLFVPSDASTAFPVFDQPDLKARFSLSATIPKYWRIISNANVGLMVTLDCGAANSFNLDSGKIIKTLPTDCGEVVHFTETKPISTYVFAFAAGDFAEFEDKESFIPSKLYVRKSQAAKLKNANTRSADGSSASSAIALDTPLPTKSRAGKDSTSLRSVGGRAVGAPIEEFFRLNREAVKYLESYFDYKFPFPKYDLVLIPEFPFGGMEHAGATFLREDRVIFPTEPTKNDYITRANVIFHEAAHQWFGDTVTMKWFDDLWLKEGFAEFMAYKTLEKVMPEYNAWKIFYERNKQAAYLTDSTRGTTPIYQEIPNLSAAKSAYGNIVYRKAPSFLRQAEFYLGEDKFQTAVRQFLKKHEFNNAEWTDLVKEFEDAAWFSSMAFYHPSDAENVTKEAEAASRKYIRDWANDWVKQAGVPIIKVIANQGKSGLYDNADALSFELKETNSEPPRWKQDTKMYVRIGKNPAKIFNRSIPPGWGETQTLSPVTYHNIPQNADVLIFPNYQDYGYGIFLLDERSRAYVLANIQTEKDDFLRTMMWGALWDSVREGELNPKDYVELVVKNIHVESDESTIQNILGRVSTAMNYYLSDIQRETLAPRVEAILIDKMQNAPTLGQRITFYRAFLNIASSEKARTILKDIQADKLKIKELKLKLKDRYDILTRLGILGDKDGEQLILKNFGRETNGMSDEERRYIYASGASLPNKETKQYYFDKFLNDKVVSENYIESAFVPFNSVRHSDLTLPYLEKALAELPNLKKNRKIFFVNGWLAAFVGGQRSEQALVIVNKFLADNPSLDKDLRLKVLEVSDGLERSVKIRKKFTAL